MHLVRTVPLEPPAGVNDPLFDPTLIDKIPKEALHFSQGNYDQEAIKEAFACVAIRGSECVVTYNTDSGLKTEWPIKQRAKNEFGHSYDKLTLDIDGGESFVSKSIDFDRVWDGIHLFEDPNNMKRKLDIFDRIVQRMEAFKFAIRQRCALRQDKNDE